MIVGLILGILMGLLAFGITMAFSEGEGTISASILLVIVAIVCIFIGIDMDTKQYEMNMRNWYNTKTVIETSMKDKNISDLEKLQLVTKITEYNMQLEQVKTDVTYWWNWYLDDSKVNELKPIMIGGK